VEAPAQALEGEVREHFEKLYESLWRQVLGVVDYRARLSKGKLSADAISPKRKQRAAPAKRTAEQKELLNICSFEADRGNSAPPGATRHHRHPAAEIAGSGP